MSADGPARWFGVYQGKTKRWRRWREVACARLLAAVRWRLSSGRLEVVFLLHVGLYVMRVGDMEIPQPAHVLAGSPALSR